MCVPLIHASWLIRFILSPWYCCSLVALLFYYEYHASKEHRVLQLNFLQYLSDNFSSMFFDPADLWPVFNNFTLMWKRLFLRITLINIFCFSSGLCALSSILPLPCLTLYSDLDFPGNSNGQRFVYPNIHGN